MYKLKTMKKVPVIFLLALTVIFFTKCSDNNREDSNKKNTVTSRDSKDRINTLLTRFDSLDFYVYSNQKWDELQLSHTEDILVHYPDGHTTKGIPAHIDELKALFVFAPDTKIGEHPVRFGAIDRTPRSGEWTSVVGMLEGTFSKPMPAGNGKNNAPTGKHFNLQMETVGHWKNGKMDEEYLFWDNMEFMKQLGLTK